VNQEKVEKVMILRAAQVSFQFLKTNFCNKMFDFDLENLLSLNFSF